MKSFRLKNSPMTKLLTVALALFVIVSFHVTAQSSRAEQALNGKTFTIKMKKISGKRDGWQWITDEISFHSGKLKSIVMTKRERFSSPLCIFSIDTSAVKETILFEVVAHNPSISQIKWQGTVSGNKITGTAIWTNAQGTQSYAFSGVEKKK